MTVHIPESLRADVEVLWSYHDLGQPLRPTDVGIGLGSHDIGVADYTAELYHKGLFPVLVFTGANSPTTVGRFPRGEAVHYRERALGLGVPDSAILVEPRATNTAENLAHTRDLLLHEGMAPRSLTLITRPYQQRRAYATALLMWPEVEIRCAAQPLRLDEYTESIGDADRVINMLVGDTQRITKYAAQGFAAPQHVPAEVAAAYQRLVSAGYNTRLI